MKSPTHSQGNTTTTTPAVPADSDWGIDTVSCWLPVNLSLSSSDTSLWSSVSTRNRLDSEDRVETAVHLGFLHKDFGDVRIELYPSDSRCRLHFNAARMVTPKSATLLPPQALLPIVEGILEEIRDSVWAEFDRVNDAGEVVRDADWQSQVHVTRIDLARNFQVPKPDLVKIGLRNAKSRHSKSTHEYTSNGTWTFENRTKTSGTDRFYDKSADLHAFVVEESLKQADRTFRFETELKKDRLSTFGLRTLDRVNDENVWDAISARWDATGWGIPIPSDGGLHTCLDKLSHSMRDNLIGFLYRRAEGLDTDMPPQYRRARDKRARELGLTPGVRVDLLGPANQYLNLFAGTVSPLPRANRSKHQRSA
jgi:hypothetical protein